MKLNTLLLTALLLTSASIAVPTIAGESGKNCASKHHATKWSQHDDFSGGDLHYMGKKLALTEAQKETVKTQREADESARTARHAKLVEARNALAAAVEAAANDAELNALADSLGKLHAEHALAGAKAKKAFLAVLTQDQKQALADAKAKRSERKATCKEAREAAKS